MWIISLYVRLLIHICPIFKLIVFCASLVDDWIFLDIWYNTGSFAYREPVQLFGTWQYILLLSQVFDFARSKMEIKNYNNNKYL